MLFAAIPKLPASMVMTESPIGVYWKLPVLPHCLIAIWVEWAGSEALK